MRVLYVEDNADLAAAVSRLLRARGHEVEAVSGVSAAASVLWGASRSPDVVLCDGQLGDGTALDLLAWLDTVGQRDGLARRVVVYTGNPTREIRREVAARGLQVVVKPASGDEVEDALSIASSR